MGDSPASMRYTEARLSKFAEDILLEKVKESGTEFIKTFDNTSTEPTILNAKVPISLINGSMGIAVGYSANLPPHNLGETIDEIIKYINKNFEYQIQLLPDYPTGGIIVNSNEVANAYVKGSSRVVIRSKIELDENKNTLTLTEIPYMKSLDQVVTSIKEASVERVIKGKKIPKKIEGIKNIKNLSAKGKIKVIIEIKRGYDLKLVENQLYKFTQCQDTSAVNFIGVNDNSFYNFNNINSIVDMWLNNRITSIKNYKTDLIEKKLYRMHIIKGLFILFNNIDEVIKIIKEGKSKQSSREELIEKFNLTTAQADYILDMKLYKISNVEINSLKEEYDTLENEKNELIKFFKDIKLIYAEIINELKEIKKKYNRPRKTLLENLNYNKITLNESIIENSNHTLILTTRYIKKLNTELKSQKRGGKGISIGKMRENDIPISILTANNKDNLLLFTDSGKVYSRKVYEINTSDIKNYGQSISSIISNDEKITNILCLTNEEMQSDEIKIVIGTKLNKVKLVSVKEFSKIHKTGIIGTNLIENDRVIFADKVLNNGDYSILAATSNGSIVNVSTKDIPEIKRTTFGSSIFSKSFITEDTNFVTSFTVIRPETTHVVIIASNGLGKKVKISEFPTQNTGGKGRMGCKLRDNSTLVSALSINNEGNVFVITDTKIVNVNSEDISEMNRPTFGSIIKKLDEDEQVLNVYFNPDEDVK